MLAALGRSFLLLFFKKEGLPFFRPAGLRAAITEIAANFLLPWLVYTALNDRYGDFTSLAASAAPPTLWSLYELARDRKIDAISMMVLSGIALSLAALLLGGSPRLLLVRENLFSIPIGLVFLLSAAMRRPIFYHMAAALLARQSDERRALFELGLQFPHVIRALRVVSIVWGAGLIAQGALLGWLAWTWPIPRYLLLSPFIGYGSIGALIAWTFLYQQAQRRNTLLLLKT
jgi:hypothetical protein